MKNAMTERPKATQQEASPPCKRARSTLPPPAKHQAVPNPAVSLQPSMDSSVTKTSANHKSAVDVQIAGLFYACSLPFNVAEHPKFNKTISMLRPGYKPPTRKAIGDKLLDTVTDKLCEDMKKTLDGQSTTLVQDGWSNCHNDSIVASCLQVGSKSYLVGSHDTGSLSKTAENCKTLSQASIDPTETDFNCTVTSVITDNASTMVKMRQGLLEDDPNLVVVGCSAHLLNLLGDDITPSAITKHVKEIKQSCRSI